VAAQLNSQLLWPLLGEEELRPVDLDDAVLEAFNDAGRPRA
jgi:hypothetical protein